MKTNQFKDDSFVMNNKSWFMEQYESIHDTNKKYALVQINIKNFRYYNTKLGYNQGNKILSLIYEKIVSILNEDEYVAHIYADNFALLMQYDDITTFLHERLASSVDLFYRIQYEYIYRNLFFSFGVTLIENNISFDDAWNHANLARRQSDSLSKRCSCIEIYEPKLYHQYIDQQELEMQTADAYKNYEFIPFYQPKVNPYTKEIIGAEALLRWFDEKGNQIPVHKFLPILNENSYIQLVDLDIFDITCEMLEKCIKANIPVVPISFNISKPYFYDENLLQDYILTFEKYEIPKELIHFELMETISLNDNERMKYVIQGFKDYGFKCMLDDFGNGYSSFNVLLNADLYAVKMDRQFFADNLNGDSKRIIKTVIDLIHSLHMIVIAEGVEEKRHIDYLKECGCDAIQGFYYYRPMSQKDFVALISKGAK